jgi:hypothetical protein
MDDSVDLKKGKAHFLHIGTEHSLNLVVAGSMLL